MKLYLGDFGLACSNSDPDSEELTNECGTPGFIDPEVLTRQAAFCEKSDVFSLGCMLFQMVSGISLF